MAVTPAAADAPILTAEQFSAGTGGRIAADDPRLQLLLDGATRGIRRACRWHVTPAITEDITLDGPGGQLLALPTLRLAAVDSVTENGEPLTDDQFEWSQNGELRRVDGRSWTQRFRGVTVRMTHGFDSAPDLAQVIAQVVANAISSPLGATREQAGQVSVSWAITAPGVSGGLSLLERDLALLNAYRLPSEA